MLYITAYDYLHYNNEDRYGAASTASRPIIEYVIKKLVKIEESIEVISVRRNVSGKGYYPSRKTQLTDLCTLTLPASRGSKLKILNWVDEKKIKIWLFYKLIKKAKKDENILIYHKTSIMIPVFLAKKIKGFKIILEVGEIYADVYGSTGIMRWAELFFLNHADKYIFSSEILNNKINVDHKPYTILYGKYEMYPIEERLYRDERIHLVYAGKLEAIKGIDNVFKLAKNLDERYIVHILGYGTDSVISEIEKKIKVCNNENKCRISYDGMLSGKNYSQFLQSCDIGLCCQDSNARYNQTSFPSKILSYLSNGLQVVASKIEAVCSSPFDVFVSTYENNNCYKMAEAVKVCDSNDRNLISDLFIMLDSQFETDLRELLEGKNDCNN